MFPQQWFNLLNGSSHLKRDIRFESVFSMISDSSYVHNQMSIILRYWDNFKGEGKQFQKLDYFWNCLSVAQSGTRARERREASCFWDGLSDRHITNWILSPFLTMGEFLPNNPRLKCFHYYQLKTESIFSRRVNSQKTVHKWNVCKKRDNFILIYCQIRLSLSRVEMIAFIYPHNIYEVRWNENRIT